MSDNLRRHFKLTVGLSSTGSRSPSIDHNCILCRMMLYGTFWSYIQYGLFVLFCYTVLFFICGPPRSAEVQISVQRPSSSQFESSHYKTRNNKRVRGQGVLGKALIMFQFSPVTHSGSHENTWRSRGPSGMDPPDNGDTAREDDALGVDSTT